MSLSVPQAQYTGLSIDTKPIPVDAPVGTTYYETDTFVTYYWTGSAWKTYHQLYKEGAWRALQSASGGDGIFQGALVATGSQGRSVTDAFGLYNTFTTSTTHLSYAGISSYWYTRAALNPHFLIVFKISTTLTNETIFAGLVNIDATPIGMGAGGSIDDPYPSNNAIGLLYRHAVGDFELYSSNATSTGAIEVTPIAPADVEVLHTFELRYKAAQTKWQYKIDHYPSWTDVTIEVPSTSVILGFQAWIRNEDSGGAATKTLAIPYIYTRMDSKG